MRRLADLTLYSTGLLSKWGFMDGDVVDDWIYDNGLWEKYKDIDDHKILEELVGKYLLPKLNHKVSTCFVGTNHNPVRADSIDHKLYGNWYEDDEWENKLKPESVIIPSNKVVLLLDKALDKAIIKRT